MKSINQMFRSLSDYLKAHFNVRPQVYVPLIIVFLFSLPLFSTNVYYRHLLIMSLVFIIIAMGLNIIQGYTGQLALGHAAFYGIGAYTFSVFVTALSVPYWLAFLSGGILAAFFAFLLGVIVLRFKGHYLAIVTLAFGEIVRVVFVNWVKVTRGPMGIMNIPAPQIFSYKFHGHLPYYYLILVIALITFLVLWRLVNSRQGRGFIAIRDEEPAAIAMGINTTQLKILAFVIGCFFAGIAGSFIAGYIRFVHPDNFTVWQSLIYNAMVVIGGEGNLIGSIFGAIILTVAPELLRAAEQYRMVIYAVVLIAMIILRPYGILGKPKIKKCDKIITDANPVFDDTIVKVKEAYANPGKIADTNIVKKADQSADLVKLEVSNISLSFGGLKALNDVSFKVYDNTVHAIIGPNGAGKSTFFNSLTGFYHPQSGSIIYKNHELLKLKPNQISKLGIARTFQKIRLFSTMSALDNVLVGCNNLMSSNTIDGMLRTRRDVDEEESMRHRALSMLRFVGLEHQVDQFASSLSYGEQRRLEIARALATDVELLLLDEPTAGMSSDESKDIIALINQLKTEKGLTIILIEHDMKLVMGISDKITVLDHGVKIAEGLPKEIQNNELVVEAYLGPEQEAIE